MDGWTNRRTDGWTANGLVEALLTNENLRRNEQYASLQGCLTLSLTRFNTSSTSSMATISLWYWLSAFFLVSRSHSAVSANIFRSYSSCTSLSSSRNCSLKAAVTFLSVCGERWPPLVRFFIRRAMMSLLIWFRQASRSASAWFRVAISSLRNRSQMGSIIQQNQGLLKTVRL